MTDVAVSQIEALDELVNRLQNQDHRVLIEGDGQLDAFTTQMLVGFLVDLRTSLRAAARDLENERRISGTLREQVGTLQEQLAEHKEDLETISARIRQEAINRDWCDEYGRWVADTNYQTHRPWMKPCYVVVERRLTIEITVEANDPEQANRALDSVIDDLRQQEAANYDVRGLSVYVQSTT